MIRPDYFILGYRVISVSNEDKKKTVQILIKNNISAKFNGDSFLIRESRYAEISSLLDTRVKFTASEIKGVYGFLYANRKRVGVICAIILTTILYILSSLAVWDVRIEGCSSEYVEEIKRELFESGLSVGTLWHKADKSKIEVELLSRSKYVSWVNINRRGNVAYVEVRDKVIPEEPVSDTGYSNIIAACDAVIEEITVEKGVAQVKAGDTVTRGQLLISGILPSESGGGFCYAEGVILGRRTDEIVVDIQNNECVKVSGKRKLSVLSLNILGFNINIFKLYGNFDYEYDIIEENRDFVILGKKIPLSLSFEYFIPYSIEQKDLTHDEMIEKARLEMQNALFHRASDATLFRIKTEGAFTESGYVLHSYITVSEEIGRNLAFEVKN